MDLITDLPPVDNFDSILVMVDQGLTNGVILIPCDKMITAEGMAKLLLDNCTKGLAYQTKLSLTKAHSLHQKRLLSC